MNISGGHLSKEFFDLVKAIGESRSKQEEDRIILTGLTVKTNSNPRLSTFSIEPAFYHFFQKLLHSNNA